MFKRALKQQLGIGIAVAATVCLGLTAVARADEVHNKRPNAAVDAGHDEGNGAELAEPFFVEKAFLENELELEFGYGDSDTESEVEIAVGASKVFFDRLQLGVEVPFVFLDPDGEDNESNIGDVGFSAKYLLYQAPENQFIWSLNGEIAASSGDAMKDIGGRGAWAISTSAAVAIPLGEGRPVVGLHGQIGYERQLKIVGEDREEAEELGVPVVREEELFWGVAINTKLHDGRVSPSLELLGHRVLDAIDKAEERTTIELGGGVWFNPFSEGGPCDECALGIAAKTVVSGATTGDYSILFVAKKEFGHED